MLDATVLINFALVNRLDLLYRVGTCLVPPAVRDEIQRPDERRALETALAGGWLEAVDPTAEEFRRAAGLMESLGPGESEAAAIAEMGQCVLAADNGAARSRLGRHGITVPYTGTAAILSWLVLEAVITPAEGNELLRRMIAQGYRSPVEDLSDVPDHSQ